MIPKPVQAACASSAPAGQGAGLKRATDPPLPPQAAQYPFWGVWGPYNASRDPWADPGVRDYMLYYVNQTSNYLLQV